ncbi:DUF305 domain-containing protein [Cellulomonas humilata]|uniref:DUF305 domain-containing protein n=2 Tax=Cellulomonadaceae TaxID=85016 RepID=A0A7Y5ZZL0_9CELL|nr:DUF305 domain-containing protein [Cellulomonas humilata]
MSEMDDDDRRVRPGPLVAMFLLIVVAAAALALWIGISLGGAAAAAPAADSVDAGFSRDMQTHHGQAVQMSMSVLETSEDPDVRTLARDIMLTQQQQAGQMHGWLTQWDLPQTSSSAPMAWMSTGGDDMAGMEHGSTQTPSGDLPMPGMAGAEDLARLSAATGSEADRLYLQLMIPHHEGGVEMAQAAVAMAADDDVRRLAQAIVDSQSAELTVLRDMLAERGGPLPSP